MPLVMIRADAPRERNLLDIRTVSPGLAFATAALTSV